MDKTSWTQSISAVRIEFFIYLTDILFLSLHRSKLALVYLPFRNYALMIDGSLVKTSSCLISEVGFQIDLL